MPPQPIKNANDSSGFKGFNEYKGGFSDAAKNDKGKTIFLAISRKKIRIETKKYRRFFQRTENQETTTGKSFFCSLNFSVF